MQIPSARHHQHSLPLSNLFHLFVFTYLEAETWQDPSWSYVCIHDWESSSYCSFASWTGLINTPLQNLYVFYGKMRSVFSRKLGDLHCDNIKTMLSLLFLHYVPLLVADVEYLFPFSVRWIFMSLITTVFSWKYMQYCWLAQAGRERLCSTTDHGFCSKTLQDIYARILFSEKVSCNLPLVWQIWADPRLSLFFSYQMWYVSNLCLKICCNWRQVWQTVHELQLS